MTGNLTGRSGARHSPQHMASTAGCTSVVMSSLTARAHVRVSAGPLAARETVAEGARGLVLSRRCGEDGVDYFEVSIMFGDDRTPTPIHIAADDRDVIARWRTHARDLGLPMMLEREDGVVVTAYDHLGCVVLGPLCLRRRGATLARRRPRFLMRRKTGRLAPAV